jgi:hypothetical protein
MAWARIVFVCCNFMAELRENRSMSVFRNSSGLSIPMPTNFLDFWIEDWVSAKSFYFLCTVTWCPNMEDFILCNRVRQVSGVAVFGIVFLADYFGCG